MGERGRSYDRGRREELLEPAIGEWGRERDPTRRVAWEPERRGHELALDERERLAQRCRALRRALAEICRRASLGESILARDICAIAREALAEEREA